MNFNLYALLVIIAACGHTDHSDTKVLVRNDAVHLHRDQPLPGLLQLFRDGKSTCSLSAIGPRIGVTAAHCFDYIDNRGQFHVETQRDKKPIYARAFSVHPHYHPTDFLLVDVSSADAHKKLHPHHIADVAVVLFDEVISPVPLNLSHAAPEGEMQVCGFGWRKQSTQSGKRWEDKGFACGQLILNRNQRFDTFFDKGLYVFEDNQNAVLVKGDSGGALIQNDRLVGVNSLFNDKTFLSAYVSLSHPDHRKFLEAAVKRSNDPSLYKNFWEREHDLSFHGIEQYIYEKVGKEKQPKSIQLGNIAPLQRILERLRTRDLPRFIFLEFVAVAQLIKQNEVLVSKHRGNLCSPLRKFLESQPRMEAENRLTTLEDIRIWWGAVTITSDFCQS